ncbi:hypothetical protein ACTWP5_27585 [Streptomyces sp. 4N509B]|uniref:hypothetical protein n=1 Tax=Streptomyces sp. 4N509B TaxID=3457413 RepID=UPI003FD60745
MAAPAVVFPDATLLATSYLRPLMAPIHVGSKVPSQRPVEMVLLRRLGGGRRNPLVDAPRLDIQVWAPDDPRADDLTQTARYHLARICEHVPEVRTYEEESGPTLIPDAPSDVPRALMTIVLSVRGAVPTP